MVSDDYIFKYNYIVLGAGGYYLAGYKDIMNLPNVKYVLDYCEGFPSTLGKKIVRANFSKAINKYLKTPFKGYVYPRLFPHIFNDDKPICYLFFANWFFLFNSTYPEYIKKQNPRNKCVLYTQDLIKRHKYLKMEEVSKKMDLLLSYDKGDSEEYGMLFYPTPMSKNPFELEEKEEKSDFYFCGKAKGRYETVQELFRKLTKQGYTCDFNILEMPSDAEHLEGIHYQDKLIDYKENLTHVLNTRCVVEVMQDGADGFTPRLWESILYDKHLLTNNPVLENSHYYIQENIHLLKNGVDGQDYNWIKHDVSYPEELKDSLSPINLLKFIDSHLS